MSNSLAIATVTAALRQHLLGAVQAVVPGADITLARPHAGASSQAAVEAASVNLYLYQVIPNPAYRNLDMPTRAHDGRLIQKPEIGLDLHYLLTFYGSQKDLEPERLLGGVIKTMHVYPLLDRRMIEQLVSDPNNGFPQLAKSDLHRAVELVKFRALTLTLEELSKLWSVFFQTPYTLSAAYVGSAVVIEGDNSPAEALPVRSRRIYVDTLRRPVVECVRAGENPLVWLYDNSRLSVVGRHLCGEVTRLSVGNKLYVPTAVSDSVIDFDLRTTVGSDLRAGVQGLQVVHHHTQAGAPILASESNVVPIVLHPRIRAVAIENVTVHDAHRDIEITVDVTPPVAPGQRIVLIFNGSESRATSSFAFDLISPAVDASIIKATLNGLTSGEYFVRIQVDGAASALEENIDGRYSAPKVVVP
jgi:Pvc16 N-terminal domain